jgi:dihydrodipicolinate reductase
MAKEFGGAFSGYSLEITESHQSTKADTSGTAKALAEDFSVLTGAPFDIENDIKMIRDAEGQKVCVCFVECMAHNVGNILSSVAVSSVCLCWHLYFSNTQLLAYAVYSVTQVPYH